MTATKPTTIVDSAKARRVAVVRDSPTMFTELYSDVFIVGDSYEQSMFAKMFAKSRCKKAFSLDDADIVVFTGGEDVNPLLYGETCHPKTRFNIARDEEDLRIYAECYEKGIPMLGICRGAQFGHVMNGGVLYQDVDGHYGDHPLFDIKNKRSIARSSSVHHQMCKDNTEGGMEIIAIGSKSRERWLNDKVVETGLIKDIEAFFYRDTCFLGLQGHPEYQGYNEFLEWSFSLMMDYFVTNTDLSLVDGVRRISPDILAMREKEKPSEEKDMN